MALERTRSALREAPTRADQVTSAGPKGSSIGAPKTATRSPVTARRAPAGGSSRTRRGVARGRGTWKACRGSSGHGRPQDLPSGGRGCPELLATAPSFWATSGAEVGDRTSGQRPSRVAHVLRPSPNAARADAQLPSPSSAWASTRLPATPCAQRLTHSEHVARRNYHPGEVAHRA